MMHWSQATSVEETMGFKPTFADPAIWMKESGNCYEYVCSYVDDLTAIVADQKAFFDELERRGFGLKGVTGDPDVFLGGSFGRDPDGMLYWGAKRYITRAMETYERLVRSKPKIASIPLPEKSHPELDTMSELDEKGRMQYQSLIGCLQWVVTLARFDIACALTTMSRFHVAPHQGHFELLGNIFGYLRKYPDGAIGFHVNTTMHEASFTLVIADWSRSVYGESFEELHCNMPTPKGKAVRQAIMVDTNLEHCKVTGQAAMGAIFEVQGTIVGHFSQRQSTVETATYASEFVAARAAFGEGVAIRYELRMLGAPVNGPMCFFGDNKSMIDSASQPAGRLQKRHLILSWHLLREKAAMGIVNYLHIKSEENVADCLTKHLSHVPLWKLIKNKLFYRYATGDGKVETLVAVFRVNDQAPNGEYQRRNEWDSELIIPLDESWIHAPVGHLQHNYFGSNGGGNEDGSLVVEVK
jgi:hypothetical protein